jgi:polar amino acid transport system substrate-binding protein
MLALGMETNERKKYLNFTSSYLEVPLVVATRVNVPFINQILDLEGEKIGIIKGDAFVKILRLKYPSLDIIEVEDIKEGLDKVKAGQLFAYIDTLASIGYEFQQKYFGELKIAGKISEELKLSIAVIKEDRTLLNILQKTVNNITNEMHREIFSKWVPIKYQKGIDYELVWKISIAAIFLIILVVYWNRKIIQANNLLKQAQKDIEEKNKELERLAITDKLTNLYNRRKLDELLHNEINRCERFNHTFGVAILDIDHFKKVNDTFGHQTGDKVLIEISNILKTHIRKTDYVGRFGGEEFVIICPESQKEGIYNLIENIRLDITKHTFKDIGKITTSFGIAILKEKDSVESLLKRADVALYEAKNSGRNRVVVNEN